MLFEFELAVVVDVAFEFDDELLLLLKLMFKFVSLTNVWAVLAIAAYIYIDDINK